ncbi:MAG: alcohol dehydrogenase catalytic domain-containing protein [Segniliparus sp.]|uniref:alcohol dehydrogenase catalytic domain-containing protein n=1 Tax=Segniliparus sp. TaxID=2804064 RepID=UPI003F36A76C
MTESSQTITTQAVRWHAARDIRLDQVQLPALLPDQVRIRVGYCGVCGSDLHEIGTGPHAIPVVQPHPISGAVAPITLGHEFSGTVVESGSEVDGLLPGTKVAVEANYRCGTCRACRRGDYHVCETGFGFIGLMGNGGLAEYANVPAYMVQRLPDDFDLAAAAVLEPAAVALRAVRRSEANPDDSAVVIGLGPVGLLVVALLAQRGIGPIIGVDVTPARRELAESLGATATVTADADLSAAIKRVTGFTTADVVFEVVGKQVAFDAAMAVLRTGGRTILIGLGATMSIDAFGLVNREQSIVASVGYNDCHTELIDLVTRRELDLTAIVTEIIELEDAPKMLTSLATVGSDQVKTLIRCDPELP